MNDSAAAHRMRVRIAEFKVVKGDSVLVAVGMGSCVAVAVYDSDRRVGGMAHILLPGKAIRGTNPYKYSESSIDAMLENLFEMGGLKEHLKAKIVGGANMFSSMGDERKSIGQRNVEAVRNKLNRLNIPIEGEDIGGNEGRTIEFHAGMGLIVIRNARGEERTI